ncbi:MAG: hypothetical protein JSS42_11350 [Proteobacteria bacterium]|nr:hypothetical protein [Pseudomonadota bacterium]
MRGREDHAAASPGRAFEQNADPMNADRPNPDLELHQAEPFRVAFALLALVLGALAALQF